MSETLYDRLGGKPAVEAAVDLFYDKLLADDRVKHFFDGIDMARQRSHQKAFMTYAFGGMQTYEGRSMREAHKKLVEEKGLNEDHFIAVAENLVMTLHELNVPADLIEEVVTIVASTKDDVLNR